jgi:predicted peptidase
MTHPKRMAALAISLVTLVGCASDDAAKTTSRADGIKTGFQTREMQLANGKTRKYSVYLPRNYDGRKSWPTLLFLQGIGEGGEDGKKQTTVGLGPYIRKHDADFGYVAIFPQSGGKWTTNDAEDIAIGALDDVEKRYNVDRSRVYLTGLSTGGLGVWRIGARHASRFAALVPMCAYDGEDYVDRLTRTPVWAFHNSFDPFVFSSSSTSTVEKINKAGGNAKVTVYGALGHNCWDRAYKEGDLWAWLAKQRNTTTNPRTNVAARAPTDAKGS